MNKYLVEKHIFSEQILNLTNSLQSIENQMDDLYKINLYLLRRYKDDLIKEFNIEIPEKVFNDPWFKLLETVFNQNVDHEDETLIFSLIISKIRETMKKEMPDPWYCYGFGGKE